MSNSTQGNVKTPEQPNYIGNNSTHHEWTDGVTITPVKRTNSTIKEQRREALNTAKERAKDDLRKILAKHGHDFKSARKNEKLWKKVKAAYQKRKKEYFQEIISNRRNNRSNVKKQISQVNPSWDSMKQKINTLVVVPEAKQVRKTNYKVPMIYQDRPDVCWFASMNMLLKFHHGMTIDKDKHLPEDARKAYDEPDASKVDRSLLDTQHIIEFSTGTGADLKPLASTVKKYSPSEISEILNQYGPIMFAHTSDSGTPHMAVVSNITSDGKLIINDPGSGIRTVSLDWFNNAIRDDYGPPLLYMKGSDAK